jgi:hypothetical protein
MPSYLRIGKSVVGAMHGETESVVNGKESHLLKKIIAKFQKKRNQRKSMWRMLF